MKRRSASLPALALRVVRRSMHGVTRRPWTARHCGLVLTVLAATPFAGCNPPRPPATTVEPTIIGVVESVAHARGDGIRLEDGTEITWDEVAVELSERSGENGDLMIYGTDPTDGGEAPWILFVPPSVQTIEQGREVRPACYLLSANGEVRGERMALSTGFSLPLADPNHPMWDQGEFVDEPMRHFCLDAAGHVLSRQ